MDEGAARNTQFQRRALTSFKYCISERGMRVKSIAKKNKSSYDVTGSPQTETTSASAIPLSTTVIYHCERISYIIFRREDEHVT